MSDTVDRTPLLAVSIDPDADVPRYRQVFEQLRTAILDGRLRPGRRLPSTRALAKELSVSRNTVMAAYDQLFAEGYIDGTVGSGTLVSETLPEDALAARNDASSPIQAALSAQRPLSKTAIALQDAPGRTRSSSHGIAFRSGSPEIDRFPWNQWSRMTSRFWRQPPRQLLSYGEVGGYMPLRTAIADYLRSVRGLICEAEQVIITTGAQQAIDLVARCLLNPGDRVWVEEPGYAGIRGVLTAVGAELVPVPVDDEGCDVAAGKDSSLDARMAIVTPSHQYPLGAVMSLSRRLELLEWAAANHAWILEDDYDSEYRYAGRPISALQGLDAHGSVIYVGTFSKVLFPAIRLGYMVLPMDLVEPMMRIRECLDEQTPIAMQPVLAEFIESGHFAAHVRRMRVLYAERQSVLIQGLERELSDVFEVSPDEAGMHIVARFKPTLPVADTVVEQRASDAGLSVQALSNYYVGPARENGLILGYAGVEPKLIERGVSTLVRVIRDVSEDALPR